MKPASPRPVKHFPRSPPAEGRPAVTSVLEPPAAARYSSLTARRRRPGVSPPIIPAMDPLANAPEWLLRPLPVNAAVDPALHGCIDALAQALPANLRPLREALDAVRNFHEYDA